MSTTVSGTGHAPDGPGPGVPLLQVEGLTVGFGRRSAPAVQDLSLRLDAGQRLGLIGESGSGKSVTALAVMGLLSETARVQGSVRWRGRELVGVRDRELAALRGSEFSMVFQEPMTALDPTMRVGRQVGEVLRLHGRSAGDTRTAVLDMLRRVGLVDADRVAESYPHQLSGGQRQRVLIAMALVNSPALVICDEPTTALDVTVQARVLRLLDEQLRAVDAACLFISHDLAVVAQVCQRVAVMWRGRIVETGDIDQVLHHPRHPYTAALVAAARLDLATPGQPLPVVQLPEEAR